MALGRTEGNESASYDAFNVDSRLQNAAKQGVELKIGDLSVKIAALESKNEKASSITRLWNKIPISAMAKELNALKSALRELTAMKDALSKTGDSTQAKSSYSNIKEALTALSKPIEDVTSALNSKRADLKNEIILQNQPDNENISNLEHEITVLTKKKNELKGYQEGLQRVQTDSPKMDIEKYIQAKNRVHELKTQFANLHPIKQLVARLGIGSGAKLRAQLNEARAERHTEMLKGVEGMVSSKLKASFEATTSKGAEMQLGENVKSLLSGKENISTSYTKIKDDIKSQPEVVLRELKTLSEKKCPIGISTDDFKRSIDSELISLSPRIQASFSKMSVDQLLEVVKNPNSNSLTDDARKQFQTALTKNIDKLSVEQLIEFRILPGDMIKGRELNNVLMGKIMGKLDSLDLTQMSKIAEKGNTEQQKQVAIAASKKFDVMSPEDMKNFMKSPTIQNFSKDMREVYYGSLFTKLGEESGKFVGTYLKDHLENITTEGDAKKVLRGTKTAEEGLLSTFMQQFIGKNFSNSTQFKEIVEDSKNSDKNLQQKAETAVKKTMEFITILNNGQVDAMMKELCAGYEKMYTALPGAIESGNKDEMTKKMVLNPVILRGMVPMLTAESIKLSETDNSAASNLVTVGKVIQNLAGLAGSASGTAAKSTGKLEFSPQLVDDNKVAFLALAKKWIQQK